ncbi:hypothetical protein E4T52_03518 [Aureobasidium sp. EXF-3400]|nr:hypothetical protein E4T52_03518 [Aureobasidium sp. EXF-3400]
MSFRALFTAGLAAFAPLASAYTTPKGDPTGNAIYEPGLNSIVPVGKPFTITWEPDTKGTVSLVLLHGPSTNCVPIHTIVEGINNTGSYDWTPDTSLAPNKTYYGIELVVDGTGQYQYSTQFGISNDEYKGSSSSAGASTAPATTTPIVNIKTPVSAQAVSASDAVSSAASSVSSVVASASSSVASQISSASSSVASGMSSASSAVSSHHSSASGSVSSAMSSMSTATKSASSSASSASKSASSSASPTASTGGAAAINAGFGGLAFAAGVVAMVL